MLVPALAFFAGVSFRSVFCALTEPKFLLDCGDFQQHQAGDLHPARPKARPAKTRPAGRGPSGPWAEAADTINVHTTAIVSKVRRNINHYLSDLDWGSIGPALGLNLTIKREANVFIARS